MPCQWKDPLGECVRYGSRMVRARAYSAGIGLSRCFSRVGSAQVVYGSRVRAIVVAKSFLAIAPKVGKGVAKALRQHCYRIAANPQVEGKGRRFTDSNIRNRSRTVSYGSRARARKGLSNLLPAHASRSLIPDC